MTPDCSWTCRLPLPVIAVLHYASESSRVVDCRCQRSNFSALCLTGSRKLTAQRFFLLFATKQKLVRVSRRSDHTPFLRKPVKILYRTYLPKHHEPCFATSLLQRQGIAVYLRSGGNSARSATLHCGLQHVGSFG